MTMTLSEALRARDAAIDRVQENNVEWITKVVAFIRNDIGHGVKFTTDDLWRAFAHPPEPRAMGAAIIAARREKLITTDGYTKSTRKECHARPIPIWRRT